MGADRRLFDPQAVLRARRARPRVDRAHRTGRAAPPTTPSAWPPRSRAPPSPLGGVSFGGMAALELALRHLRPAAVVPDRQRPSPAPAPAPGTSARSPGSFPFCRCRASAKPMASSSAAASHLGLERTAAHRLLFADMLRATPPTFLQWAGCAIAGWPGADGSCDPRTSHPWGRRPRHPLPARASRCDRARGRPPAEPHPSRAV